MVALLPMSAAPALRGGDPLGHMAIHSLTRGGGGGHSLGVAASGCGHSLGVAASGCNRSLGAVAPTHSAHAAMVTLEEMYFFLYICERPICIYAP